jgi:hypothetical protein
MTTSRFSCTIPYSSYLQPGWPTNWEDLDAFVPEDGMQNTCRDCTSLYNDGCRRNTQSPIRLERNATARRECKDQHRMNFVTGNCHVEQVDFEILPHGKCKQRGSHVYITFCLLVLYVSHSMIFFLVLRAYQPHGCGSLPNIDFSRGFPDPWHLAFTDISVPSQHVQGGKRYDAEVVLSHVYSKEKDNKLVSSQFSLFAMFCSMCSDALMPQFFLTFNRLAMLPSFSKRAISRTDTTFSIFILITGWKLRRKYAGIVKDDVEGARPVIMTCKN